MRDEYINFVTVATTWYPIRAWLIRNLLDAYELDAIVVDEQAITMDWLIANAIGGIKVQVPLSQAERAIEVLEQEHDDFPRFVTSSPNIPHCEACGSIDVANEMLSKRGAYISWFFLGVPVPIIRDVVRCLTCGVRRPLHSPDENAPKPFQFSLLSLMTWVTIAAIFCGMVRLAVVGAFDGGLLESL